MHTGCITLITGVLITCLGAVLTHTNLINRTKAVQLNISPIMLHSASSVSIPSSVIYFQNMRPIIRLSPLGSPMIRKNTKLFSVLIDSECIEDIQMFLLNMSFISQVKWTIFIFHEWRSHE